MPRRKGTEPEQYAGPYQRYSEIPRRYRLETYAPQYEDDDTWERYLQEDLFESYDSDHIRITARRAEQSWREHMRGRGRHHALATPSDVRTWCEALLDSGRSQTTCYDPYYMRIYHFYEWLKQHYRHPHHYNPLLIAAVEYETVRRIWKFRVETREEAVSRE